MRRPTCWSDKNVTCEGLTNKTSLKQCSRRHKLVVGAKDGRLKSWNGPRRWSRRHQASPSGRAEFQGQSVSGSRCARACA